MSPTLVILESHRSRSEENNVESSSIDLICSILRTMLEWTMEYFAPKHFWAISYLIVTFRKLYSGRTLLLCMTFGLIIMTSKHFWLLQSTWHQTRVTYLWCIANCSHWNHHIWSQELWEHKFLVLKKVLLFYRSMLRLSSLRSCDHIQWFQWLQVVIHHRYVTLVWSHMHWSS